MKIVAIKAVSRFELHSITGIGVSESSIHDFPLRTKDDEDLLAPHRKESAHLYREMLTGLKVPTGETCRASNGPLV